MSLTCAMLDILLEYMTLNEFKSAAKAYICECKSQ